MAVPSAVGDAKNSVPASEMKDFDPNPAIEAWRLGAKTKRHAMKRVHDAPVVVPTAGPSVSEPFQALPPLPELPQIDSSSDSDSE